jgi:hypothetical protein
VPVPPFEITEHQGVITGQGERQHVMNLTGSAA